MPDPDRQVRYIGVVRATIAAGILAKGIASGMAISERAEKIAGVPTMFLPDYTGNYGGVAWISTLLCSRGVLVACLWRWARFSPVPVAVGTVFAGGCGSGHGFRRWLWWRARFSPESGHFGARRV